MKGVSDITNYIVLKGSEVLIIFQKYLDSIGVSSFKFADELINALIETNKERFVELVRSGVIILNKNEKEYLFYKKFEQELAEQKIKEIPDFESLSPEALKKIMEKVKDKE